MELTSNSGEVLLMSRVRRRGWLWEDGLVQRGKEKTRNEARELHPLGFAEIVEQENLFVVSEVAHQLVFGESSELSEGEITPRSGSADESMAGKRG